MTRDSVHDGDAHEAASGSVLSRMRKAELLRALKHAESQAPGSADAMTLEKWVLRLLPYLEREPELTIADALLRYRADAQRGSQKSP